MNAVAVAFDTLKAATRLQDEAGFSEQQAHGLVKTFAEGIAGNIVTRQDLTALATKQDLTELPTRTDLAEFATKQDLAELPTMANLAECATRQFATKQDLAELPTMANLAECATRQDLAELPTKQDQTGLGRVRHQGGPCGRA